jgi:hypothetical protein
MRAAVAHAPNVATMVALRDNRAEADFNRNARVT